MAGKDKLQVGVIGLGKFGYKFGKTLVELGQTVVGVDSDPDKIKRAQQIFTQVYSADATNKKALEQLGMADFSHVLVSVGDSIAASSMISMYLKELGVPMVLVKAVNSDHEKLLRKIGADEVIVPEHHAAREFANRLAVPGFIEHLPFDKDVALKEFPVKNWENMTLRDLDITNRFNVQIIAVRKRGEPKYRYIPKASDTLRAGDTVVVMGLTEHLARLEP